MNLRRIVSLAGIEHLLARRIGFRDKVSPLFGGRCRLLDCLNHERMRRYAALRGCCGRSLLEFVGEFQ